MAEFVPMPGFTQVLRRSTQLLAVLVPIAEDIAQTVRSQGPRDEDEPRATERDKKHYVEEIEVVQGIDNGTVTARVNANKYTAHWLEFGTSKMSPLAPLRRAAESAGFRLRGGYHR